MDDNINAVGRLPIGEALPGVTIKPLEEGDEPLAVYALIKVRTADGGEGWSIRTPHPMNDEEFVGALTFASDLWRRRMLDSWDD